MRPRSDRIVGHALRRYVACSLLALLTVLVGSVLLSHHIASEEATHEARERVSSLARGVVAPLTGKDLRDGDSRATETLDSVLTAHLEDGAIEHVTVLTGDGRVLWSDGGTDASSRVRLTAWAQAVLAARDTAVGPPLASVGAAPEDLVDVYVGVRAADGRPVLVVATVLLPVRADQWHLVEELVPVTLLSLVAFALATGWLGLTLARRVESGLRHQAVLERKAFVAADRERRRLARDLHDGVIQELSAATYALPLVHEGLAREEGLAHRTLGVVGDILTRQLTALRTLMLDVYPPRLTDGGLVAGLEMLATTARRSGLRVELDVRGADEIDATGAELTYRVVREGLANVVRHARAGTARVSVHSGAEGLSVEVRDDGCGPGRSTAPRDPGGHLGLVLVRDSFAELGGSVAMTPGEHAGTVLSAWLPARPADTDATASGVSEVPAGH